MDGLINLVLIDGRLTGLFFHKRGMDIVNIQVNQRHDADRKDVHRNIQRYELVVARAPRGRSTSA